MDKERLKEYLWIKENVQELEDRLLEIDTKLQHITSTLDADKVQTTKNNDKWTELIQQRIKLAERINRELAKGYKEMEHIEDTIEKLPEREKLLMRYRYIDGKKWEEICFRMGYEWRQVHRIHAEVLAMLLRTQN